MAYQLFQDIEDFKKYAGGAVNSSLAMQSIEPTLYMTTQTQVLPWLGNTLYLQLVEAVAAGPVDPASDLGKLLPYACRPVALLSLWQYADVGTVQLGGSGMFRTETEERKSAFKYQEANYRESMLQQGFEALELMQRFLDDNAATYADWTAKNRSRELVINYAAELRETYSKSVSRYTFEMLRSLIPDLELFALVPSMGQAQYDELKTAILADAALPDRLAELLRIVQRVIANFVVEEAMRRHWVTLDGHQVVSYVQQSLDARQQTIPANMTLDVGTGLKLKQAEEFAERWLSRLTYFLDNNVADFPLYAAWKAEQETTTEEVDRANHSHDYYLPSSTAKRKGVRRL